MSSPSRRMLPLCRVPSIRSFMRLSRRRNVDLPQPEGPIRAVTERQGMLRLMSNKACLSPYRNDRPLTANLAFTPVKSSDLRPCWLRSEMIAEYVNVDTDEPRGSARNRTTASSGLLTGGWQASNQSG